MRRLLVGILAVCCLPNAALIHANPLQGSWQLVSGKIIDGDKVTAYDEAGVQGIKVIAGNHFSFVSHTAEGFYAAAAGQIVIDGNNYSEMPLYSSYPPLIGATFSFTFAVEDDIWEKSRYESGELVEFEIWRRLP